MNRGNARKLRAEIKAVAQQLQSTRTTFSYYRAKYGVSSYTLKRELRAIWDEEVYLAIAKAKLAQGNEPQRWTSAWGIRGAAARKYKAVGSISIRTRHRRYGPGPKKQTRVTKIPYIKIKDEGTRDQCWMLLKDYNWIKANGPIPHGLYVVCKSGDTMDCRPENLILSNRHDHILLNKHNFPGMDARGAASFHIIKKRHPYKYRRVCAKSTLKKIDGPKAAFWLCPECGWSCDDNKPPERCPKCGRFALEILKRKIA